MQRNARRGGEDNKDAIHEKQPPLRPPTGATQPATKAPQKKEKKINNKKCNQINGSHMKKNPTNDNEKKKKKKKEKQNNQNQSKKKKKKNQCNKEKNSAGKNSKASDSPKLKQNKISKKQKERIMQCNATQNLVGHGWLIPCANIFLRIKPRKTPDRIKLHNPPDDFVASPPDDFVASPTTAYRYKSGYMARKEKTAGTEKAKRKANNCHHSLYCRRSVASDHANIRFRERGPFAIPVYMPTDDGYTLTVTYLPAKAKTTGDMYTCAVKAREEIRHEAYMKKRIAHSCRLPKSPLDERDVAILRKANKIIREQIMDQRKLRHSKGWLYDPISEDCWAEGCGDDSSSF